MRNSAECIYGASCCSRVAANPAQHRCLIKLMESSGSDLGFNSRTFRLLEFRTPAGSGKMNRLEVSKLRLGLPDSARAIR